MRQCPRCASEINKNDKFCPKCRLEVKKMAEYAKAQGLEWEEKPESDVLQEEKAHIKTKNEKKLEKQEKKQAKKQAKLERKLAESKSDTDFSKFAKNSEENKNKSYADDTFSSRRKARKEKETIPQFELDENGEFNIDTNDVEIVGKETGKLIEEEQQRTYSIKKARGDYRPPRIKWWEIYKLADRSFARRKIKKEVNKAAVQKPSFIKQSKLLLLAIFLGWIGAHNFYAKNKKKGWVSVVTFIIWMGVVFLGNYSTFFASIEISVGGFAGFIDLFIWISDVISIIINKFKYRIQKEAFIFGMNIETRAKLGEKYIDLELYKKPWWVRFKVWCEHRKRNWQEDQKERRQAKIDREKKKLAKKQEQEKIDAEIAEFEAKENAKLERDGQEAFAETEEQSKSSNSKKQSNISKTDISKIIDKKTLSELNSFDGGLTESPKEEKNEETR
jgi:hypothetical protein